MYTHEVVRHGQTTAMIHRRETQLPSGLLTVRELGHTVAIPVPVTSEHSDQPEYGISLPNVYEIDYINSTRLDEQPTSSTATDSILAEDLKEFVHLGIDQWQKILDSLGSVIKIDVHLAEKRRVIEDTTPSGLIIASHEPTTEFAHYIARPEEIDAIEKIATGVQTTVNPPPENTGLYK